MAVLIAGNLGCHNRPGYQSGHLRHFPVNCWHVTLSAILFGHNWRGLPLRKRALVTAAAKYSIIKEGRIDLYGVRFDEAGGRMRTNHGTLVEVTRNACDTKLAGN